MAVARDETVHRPGHQQYARNFEHGGAPLPAGQRAQDVRRGIGSGKNQAVRQNHMHGLETVHFIDLRKALLSFLGLTGQIFQSLCFVPLPDPVDPLFAKSAFPIINQNQLAHKGKVDREPDRFKQMSLCLGIFDDLMVGWLISMSPSLMILLIGLNFAPVFGASDPIEELKSFSVFQEIDLQKLVKGDILTQKGALIDFPKGISVQSCYVIMLPAEKTARLLRTWDPSPHKALKVYSHCPVRSPPTAEDFQPLNLDSDQFAIQWLVDKTRATTPDKSDLMISHDEATEIARGMERGAQPVSMASQCWRKILKVRASKFQEAGLSALPAYEMGDDAVSSASELEGLLKSEPRVALRFFSLLSETPLMKRLPLPSSVSPYYYCDFLAADNHAIFNLGAVYLKDMGNHYQMLDCCYYSSGEFYVSLVLREIQPIQIGDKTGSLVWRGDFLSAPSLASTKGVQRMAYGAIMSQGVKGSIRCFCEDALQAP